MPHMKDKTCEPSNPCIYGLPPKYKKLINISGAWNKPAVVYPASIVESIVFRADMESA